VPDTNTIHHLYQAIVAIWPLAAPDDASLASLRERLAGYAVKAAREAKTRTSWIEPDSAFEAALQDYVAALLDPGRSPEFLGDLAEFVGQVGRIGLWNAFARILLQLTAPGIPDIYQGDELWNFSLVDPDNRRPVDFALRGALLESLPGVGEPLDELLATPEDGRLKLYLVRTVLDARKRHPELFLRGTYLPLAAEGPVARHLVAFARRHDTTTAVVLVPRLLASAAATTTTTASADMPADPMPALPWGDTAIQLPPGWPAEWRSVLTGGECAVDEGGWLRLQPALGRLPGALLIGRE
jgi:(1->4)-alpha-D-glucan 1-alpha-D-glucosylmutase